MDWFFIYICGALIIFVAVNIFLDIWNDTGWLDSDLRKSIQEENKKRRKSELFWQNRE